MAQHNYPTIGQAFLGTKILSASATLAGTDSGKAFSNASASGNITVTLPQAKPGYTFQFLEVAAHNIVVTPQATDNIRGLSAGTGTTLSAAGSLLYLECINAGTWEIVISQPIVAGISSVAGTANEIAVSTVAGVATISFAPNIIIPAPPSGNALIVNGAASSFASQINASTTSTHSFGLDINAGTTSTDIALEISNAVNSVNYMVVWGDGHTEIGPNVGSGTNGLVIANTGAALINAPSSGATLTLNGGAAAQIGVFNGTAGNTYFDYKRVGTLIGRVGSGDSIIVSGNAADFAITAPNGNLVLGATGSTHVVTISNAGAFNLEIESPSSGPWGLQINRTDIANIIHVFNNAGIWWFNEPVSAPSYQVGAVTVSFPSTGSFTAGTTGLTGATIAAKYTISGNSVTLFLAKPSTIVSNATTFTVTGLPAAIQPTTAKYAACNPAALNASSFGAGFLSALVSGSTITLALNGTTWTATGNKNYADAVSGATFVYTLD